MIRSEPALPWPEQRDLLLQAQAGSKDAEDRLVRTNLGVVLTIAKRFRSRYLTTEELVAAGTSGLLRAIREWDRKLVDKKLRRRGNFRKSYRFTTLVHWFAERAMQHADTKATRKVLPQALPRVVDDDVMVRPLEAIPNYRRNGVDPDDQGPLAVLLAMPERERKILEAVHGVEGELDLRIDTAARRLRLTPAHVARVYAQVVERLRAAAQNRP